MAIDGEKSPPQKPETQPGKEHVVNPVPQTINPDYKPANRLQGKVALVTGGDSGIGKAVCYCFTRKGASVAFTYVKGQEDKDKDDTLQMIVEAKKSDAKDPTVIPADVGFDENCKWVKNIKFTYPESHRLFEDLYRQTLKHMREGSSIINSTSVNACAGNPMTLDYTATKGAIVIFTRGLALQLVDKGIRVNAVAPGPVWTPLQVASMPEDMSKNLGSETPMKRARPFEIAPSYEFLASPGCASEFTGQVLHPNGGMIVNA